MPGRAGWLRSWKPSRFWIGFTLGILFVLSAANFLVLLFIVPKFELVFADLTPDKLPAAPAFIISARVALIVITMAWPTLGTLLATFQSRYAVPFISLGVIWSFLQLTITILAFSLAAKGVVDGVADPITSP